MAGETNGEVRQSFYDGVFKKHYGWIFAGNTKEHFKSGLYVKEILGTNSFMSTEHIRAYKEQLGARSEYDKEQQRAAAKRSKRKSNAARRDLENIEIAPIGEGEIAHHINDTHVVGIPKEVHVRLSGYSRIKHRALILEWLEENNKDIWYKVFWILGEQ